MVGRDVGYEGRRAIIGHDKIVVASTTSHVGFLNADQMRIVEAILNHEVLGGDHRGIDAKAVTGRLLPR